MLTSPLRARRPRRTAAKFPRFRVAPLLRARMAISASLGVCWVRTDDRAGGSRRGCHGTRRPNSLLFHFLQLKCLQLQSSDGGRAEEEMMDAQQDTAIYPGYHPRPSSSLPSTAAVIHGHQSRLSSTAIVVTTINRGCHTRPSSSLPLQLATRCNSTKTTDILIANALHVGHIFVMVLSSHTCRFLSSSCEILRTHANAAMGFFQILRGRAVVAAFFGDLFWLPGLRHDGV